MPSQAASVVGDRPSVQISSLYRKGVPLNDIAHTLTQTTPDGEFKSSLSPHEDGIFLDTWWRRSPLDEPEKIESWAKVEWVDWGFGSRRPFALCSDCERRVSRAFIATDVPAGTLVCHGCAGVRYRSQDAPLEHRLTERIHRIRTRLGGSPALGRTDDPVPSKPPRMHWRTYDRLTGELAELEATLRELEEVRTRIVQEQIYAARRRALRRLAPAYEQLARLEEHAKRSL